VAIQAWARMSKAHQLVVVGLASMFVLCCGGLTAFGLLVGSPPQKAPTPKVTATQVVATPADTTPSSTSPVPPTDVPTTPVVATTTQAPAPPPPPVTTTEADPPPDDVYYANCDAVRAAGAAPLYRGQPGYRPKLDRDGDGVACE
jgi:excalibur calcium-binding domain-containing protein